MRHPTDLRKEETMRYDEAENTPKTTRPHETDSDELVSLDAQEENGREASEAGEGNPLQAENQRLQADRDQLLDRLARLQADFDNYRKREGKERAEYRDYALANTVEQFLPVLDNFQLALRSQGSLEQLRSGVELIVRQMEEIVRSLGILPVSTVDTQFDPRLHEAIDMVDRDDVPDQQILEEVRRGYTLRERLLRPALVRVANNPKQKKA